MTDHEILNGLKSNNKKVFSYLYSKFGPSVLGYVLKNSGSRNDGDEVLQTTVLKVWEKITQNQYEDRGKFGHFFFTVAANTWREVLRKRKRDKTIALGKSEEFITDDGNDDLSRKIVKNKSLDAIYQSLSKLGEICQELINLYHFQEQPLKSIAEEKGWDYANLRKRIFDCRKKLKKLAEKELNTKAQNLV